MKECIFILGGARSGKSRFAQELAADLGEKVLFVATGEGLDEERRLRIEEHRKKRPKTWRTLEVATNVGRKVVKEIGDAEVVIIDCLTLLISNLLHGNEESGALEGLMLAEMEELIECIDRSLSSFIIVSNEVGSGLVPASRLERVYRDTLGRANQIIARRADRVYIMFAGIPVEAKHGR